MLEVKGIDVSYGHARVVHDLNLRLDRGEMVFIVGRNGAGKTTLLKTVAGLLRPVKGTITFQDKEIHGLPAEKLARRGFRFVAQEKKVFSSLTVRSNIELAAHGAGEDLDTALKKATSIYPDLSRFMDKKAGGLSGGQREILLIGRALIGEPKILLIDEPTEGLAVIVIEDIFRILREMKEKVSAVIVEQNLSVVSRLADRIYIMKEGKIIKEFANKAEIADITELERYL